MSLSIEWGRRLDHWRAGLKRHFYTPLGAVAWEGFVTREQLSAGEAAERTFMPMPEGTAWGAKWEYGWFRGAVALPQVAADKLIVLQVELGGESAVYVNRVATGARDRQHTEITLAQKGATGARYEILVEAYAGHGPRVSTVGPVPLGQDSVPEPGPTQAVIGQSSYGVWNEEVYQLWVDVETLYHLRNHIDPESLRVSEIDRALREFTTIVDLELPLPELIGTTRVARALLRPLLGCANGSTAPTMFVFGHSHIDVAWLWPLAETERKCVRTFATQLALMERYPEYRFLQSQPHLYWMVKNRYPDLYERIKQAVARGQWIPEGGMWVEADTNISSGESLIRQFIHGKRFFRDEFGVECKMLWLPDVFGYSGNMPQIMKGCGIQFFSTAKIFWSYNGGDPFPYNTFTWEGIDGSKVLVHLCNDYNSEADPGKIIQRWTQRVQKDGIATRLAPFGWGDGGGGPTRDHLEYLRRMGDLEGAPRTRMDSPIAYFDDQEARGVPGARYVGELYFQAHRGVQTSQARTKRGNRKSELALREAEMWAVAAQALHGFVIPREALDTAWRTVLLNQFHDIIPGSSIHRVYEEAEAAYDRAIAMADGVRAQACAALANPGEALTVYNSLSWPRTAWVPLPAGYHQLVNSQGETLPIQAVGNKVYAEVALPPCGWRSYGLKKGLDGYARIESPLIAQEGLLENEFLRVTFNRRGEITSIYDKETGRDWAAGACNALRMYKDVPTAFDAWDIDSMYQQTPVALESSATIQVLGQGPLAARLEVRRRLNESAMVQVITLRRGSRVITFDTEIDWQERHKLLKVEFPVDVHAHEALHEIQFGHIARPNHASRPFDADRFEVANHKWTALAEANRGAAVLNDCKYGVNVLGNSINLTLLKSPLAPDMTADRGQQRFSYAFYAWNGSMMDSDLLREAYALNCPPTAALGDAGEASLFAVDAPNIVIETVKPAEDGSGDVVVRLYEAQRTATSCTLKTALPLAHAAVTDMLEENGEPIDSRGGEIALCFTPFEVKTLRLSMLQA
jgi:alpha-mannosidase